MNLKTTGMKKLLILSFMLASLRGVCQLIPSTVGQVYNFSVGDSFEYSYSETEAMVNCGISGVILDIVTGYELVNDTITYTLAVQRSMNHYPCPNYSPPYGILYDSFPQLKQIVFADSSLFSDNISTGVMQCQGLTSAQCYDSVYIAQTGAFTGMKLNQFVLNGLSSTNSIWIDSLGMVKSYVYAEGLPSVIYETDLIFYHKASGQMWNTFQAFSDHSLYAGVNDLASDIHIQVSPNPATGHFEMNVDGLSGVTGNGPAKLYITDVLGQQIFEQNQQNGKTSIDCTTWSKGLYLWTVGYNGRVIKSGKLAVE